MANPTLLIIKSSTMHDAWEALLEVYKDDKRFDRRCVDCSPPSTSLFRFASIYIYRHWADDIGLGLSLKVRGRSPAKRMTNHSTVYTPGVSC